MGFVEGDFAFLDELQDHHGYEGFGVGADADFTVEGWGFAGFQVAYTCGCADGVAVLVAHGCQGCWEAAIDQVLCG